MERTGFFAAPPKAERAFLSAYGAEELHGQYGIRIETEPLSFVSRDFDRELEPEIHLCYLSLPSIDPANLENTRFTPDSKYEGSFYFLGEHNWVDLKEIRFRNAVGDSIGAEYDLVIHLPTPAPNEYPITLCISTEIKSRDPRLEAARSVRGLGIFVQEKENFWKSRATYDGHDVEIEFSADAKSFDDIAAYARSVIAEETLPRSKMDQEIAEGLGFLEDKFKQFNVSVNFKAEEFVPLSFYFHKRRHHAKPELIVVLHHPSDVGHWSLTF
jgi:hypothetical protein